MKIGRDAMGVLNQIPSFSGTKPSDRQGTQQNLLISELLNATQQDLCLSKSAKGGVPNKEQRPMCHDSFDGETPLVPFLYHHFKPLFLMVKMAGFTVSPSLMVNPNFHHHFSLV